MFTNLIIFVVAFCLGAVTGALVYRNNYKKLEAEFQKALEDVEYLKGRLNGTK